jgi:exodeoxyribonuclease VII large subunit
MNNRSEGEGRQGGAPRHDLPVLTVSELNATVRSLLEEAMGEVWVEGEISNLRRYPSGHTYFTLKDEAAQVAAVLFRGHSLGLRFRPEDGQKVLARGRVGLYEPRGSYQIIVDRLEPAGLGALQAALEQLKTRLQQEGLFDADRKRPLPLLPQRIGVVTSPRGAAIRDFLRVLERRFANLNVIVAPARVQGDGSAAEVVAAIGDLNRLGRLDVIVVTRGGGSLEDLWTFNEEPVARAIAASSVPVISAVGHEIDVTIADLVADLRAPTPSAAAEMVVRSKQELVERIGALRSRLASGMRLRVSDASARLEMAGADRALASMRARLRDRMLQIDDLMARMEGQLNRELLQTRHRLEILLHRISPRRLAERLVARRAASAAIGRRLQAAMLARLREGRDRTAGYGERLTALSPLAVLSRGYAICHASPGGAILKEARGVHRGDLVEVRLHRGRLECEVKEVRDATREEEH